MPSSAGASDSLSLRSASTMCTSPEAVEAARVANQTPNGARLLESRKERTSHKARGTGEKHRSALGGLIVRAHRPVLPVRVLPDALR